MAGNPNRTADAAARAMRDAALRVADALQEEKRASGTPGATWFADVGRPAGQAFTSYFESAMSTLDSLVGVFGTLSRTASPRNRHKVDMAAGIAWNIADAAGAADRLGMEGCSLLEEKARDLSWDFGELNPRRARKQAQTYFQNLRDLTSSLSRIVGGFNLAATLQERDRDKFEQVNQLCEGIGRAAEHTAAC